MEREKRFIQISKILDDSFRIVLVGLNETQAKNMPEKIVPLGRVKNPEDLVDLYNIADVYVNLSLEETFGLPTAEAMSCGTPVIVLDSTANPELVDDGVGTVVREYSAEKVVDTIKYLSDRKEKMTPNCIEKVKNSLSVTKMTDAYIRIYKSIYKRTV